MTEIHCPMCGKLNSDQLEVCQFCDARLKPLILSSQEDDAAYSLPVPGADESDESLPDWLISMRGEDDSPAEPVGESTPEEETEAQGWLDRIRDESAAPLDGEASSPEDDDWLQRMRSLQSEDQQEAQDISEPESEEEKPSEWASDFVLDKDEIDADENGEPDWLSGEAEEIAPESAGPSVEGELPDWLRAEVAEPTPAVASGEGDLPDWLNREDEEIAPEPAAPALEGELPDWFSDLGGETSPSGELETEPIAPSLDVETPDWFSDLGGETSPSGELETEQIAPSLDVETPDWVADLGGSDESASAPPSEADDMPEWFTDLGEEETTLFKESEVARPTPAEGEEIPDLAVSRLAAPIAPFVVDDEFDNDLLDVDKLPDWLAGRSGNQDIEDAAESSDLAPAELPGWLEAMRPVKTSIPGTVLDDDGPVESAGPLAGLRNVLPAEPGIDKVKKPPIYSVKLHVADSQQAHAALFEELLANEGQALPIPPPPLLSSQWILRWLIALILFVVIGFVVVGGSQNVPLPDQADVPTETFSASKLVNALSADAPVLVAFDYEPGMSGEMNATAAALVDHLMLRGALLTLVSTSPTGPAMAEYFLRNIEAEHGYVSGVQYINLGYIPGGAAGLRGFAEMPRLITTLSFDGMNPWDTPPLLGVDTISDFALAVLITDDSDTARIWIEQVQPKLDNTPFVAVVSAQAEPMVRPYYGTQVQGMVAGLMGGAAYEQTMGQDSYNLARVYWDAFSVGLIVAVAAILIGGAVNIISVLLAHRKGTKGEAV